MINKYFDGIIPVNFSESNEPDPDLEKVTSQVIEKYSKEMDAYHLSNSIIEIWNLISRTNKYIDETRPWELAKNEETEKLASSMYHLIENIRKVGVILLPFMEETAQNLLRRFEIKNVLSRNRTMRLYHWFKKLYRWIEAL